jgi:hypothetical protein
MKRSIRLILDASGRIAAFQALHPDASPGGSTVGTRLGALIVRGNQLVEQEFAGHRTVQGAVENKTQLRDEIVQHVAVLSGIAGAVARQERDLAPGIPMPGRRASDQVFLGRARDAHSAATAKKEILQKYGMPDTLLDELGALIDRYDAVLNEKHAGRAAHIGAHAELESVAAELMSVARQLDAINRFRFRDDPQLLEAWRAARNVAWPAGSKSGGTTGGPTAQAPAPAPSAGEQKPAA